MLALSVNTVTMQLAQEPPLLNLQLFALDGISFIPNEFLSSCVPPAVILYCPDRHGPHIGCHFRQHLAPALLFVPSLYHCQHFLDAGYPPDPSGTSP